MHQHHSRLPRPNEAGTPPPELGVKTPLAELLESFTSIPLGRVVHDLRTGALPASDAGSVGEALPEVRAITALAIERVYEQFVDWVAKGRTEPDEIAVARRLSVNGVVARERREDFAAELRSCACWDCAAELAYERLGDTLKRFVAGVSPGPSAPPDLRELVKRFEPLPKHALRREAAPHHPERLRADLEAGIETAVATFLKLAALIPELHFRATGTILSPDEFTPVYRASLGVVREFAALPLVVFGELDRALSRVHSREGGSDFSLYRPDGFAFGREKSGLYVDVRSERVRAAVPVILEALSELAPQFGGLLRSGCPVLFARCSEGPIFNHLAEWIGEVFKVALLPEFSHLFGVSRK